MPTHTAKETLAEEEAHVEGLDETGTDMSRILGMSDAVFAFSMTFLVIDLVLPKPSSSGTYTNLSGYLGTEWPSLVAYMISFFIIASWWGVHRRIFSPIVQYDSLLVRLNNFFLLIIAITPFLVGILFDYGPGVSFSAGTPSTQLAVAIYALAQLVGGMLLLAVWHHSTQDHRLVVPTLPQEWIRRTELAQLANVVIFAVSIPVAFAAPLVSMLMWIVMIIGGRHLLLRRRIPRRQPVRPVAPT